MFHFTSSLIGDVPGRGAVIDAVAGLLGLDEAAQDGRVAEDRVGVLRPRGGTLASGQTARAEMLKGAVFCCR